MLNRILKRFGQNSGRDDSETVIFKPEKLKALSECSTYKTAEPFPNLVMDDFFEPEALNEILEEWPDATRPDLEHHNDGTYVRKKTGSSLKTTFGPFTRRFLHRLGEPDFLQALEQVTGIWGLIPDPYLFGGGIHQTQAGGKLAVHADFNKHFKLPLDRRLNLLLYLNKGWTEDNGGWFEMWDHEMKGCVKRVLPTFNRMAIFSTTDFSFHGQPEEIVGPPTLFRRSSALYYYSVGRPEHEIYEQGEHSTLWRERPEKGF